MSVCESLRDDCREAWQALHEHPFILGLADGTLPPERFRFYCEQDLFFLPALGRAIALGVSRSDEPRMRHFAEELAIVVGRELDNQRTLLERVVALGAADRGGSSGAAPACLAYGCYLVATAARGDALDLMAAVLPCTWSYADIAFGLRERIAPHPVYAEWVGFFADPGYVELIAQRRAAFDALAAGVGAARRERLSAVLTTSTRLEREFWDMSYGLAHWADLGEDG